MAGYDISVGKDLLPGLLSGQDGLAKLEEAVLNQILEAQAQAPDVVTRSMRTLPAAAKAASTFSTS